MSVPPGPEALPSVPTDPGPEAPSRAVEPVRWMEVLIGSRDLAGSPAEDWGKRIAWDRVRQSPPEAVIVSGGARGPDQWASLAAYHARRRCLELRLDGRRWWNGRPAEAPKARWTEAAPPQHRDDREVWKAWCLARDRALVAVAREAAQVGWTVRVSALIAPWPKRTHGTEYTAEHFAEAGLRVFFHYAPRSFWPEWAREGAPEPDELA